jgi:hypothetical protein
MNKNKDLSRLADRFRRGFEIAFVARESVNIVVSVRSGALSLYHAY